MYHEPAVCRGMPAVGNGAGAECATSGASVAPTASSGQSHAPEMNTRDVTAPAFNPHITLVIAPVLVRDMHGVAVDNLTKASFQLFDKGKPQEISRFSMEKTGGKPPLIANATPDRKSTRLNS